MGRASRSKGGWRDRLASGRGGGRHGHTGAAPDAGGVPPSPPVPHEPNPDEPELLDGFDLCAVVKTWDDEDIVETVVHHAYAQGADAVFVVDNRSTDDTVALAEKAGATVAEEHRTDACDGRLAQTLVNAVVARESLRRSARHVWWLRPDNDEFAEGPDSLTVRQFLAGLDRRFRLVGATCHNHLPSGKPESRAVLYKDRDSGGGLARRLRSLDAVYAGRLGEVETVPCRNPDGVRHPVAWPGTDRIPRWYEPADLQAARDRWAGT